MKLKVLELNLREKKSHTETCKQYSLSDFSSLETLAHDRFGDIGFCVFYLDNKVIFGKYDGKNFLFYKKDFPKPEYIQKMRLFSQNQELLLWKKRWNDYSGDFAFRLRVDEEGANTDVIDAMQVLWGTKANILDENFTELSEKRGMKIIVPLKEIEVDDNDKRLFILTRNYITYETDRSETHKSEANDPSYMQASYCDSRFVSFTDKDGNLLGW